MTVDREPIWQEWFDKQYDLVDAVRRAVRQQSHGRDRQFAAALLAALMESVAEDIRTYLDPGVDPLATASTREVLDEVANRMENTQNSTSGRELGRLCREAVDNLDAGVLDYRPSGS